jgi:hypothetical protein
MNLFRGTSAFDGVGGKKLVQAACWSYAGRERVDAAAREQEFDHAQRHQLRKQKSAPLLESLPEALKAEGFTRGTASP